jgi:hypothetical protein
MIEQIIALIVILAFLVGLPWFMIHLKKKHRAESESTASQMGFTYEGMGDGSVARAFGSFQIFSKHHSVQEYHIMTRREGTGRIVIVNGYSWTTRRGKNTTHTDTTVFCFESPELDLPPLKFVFSMGGSLMRKAAEKIACTAGFERVEEKRLEDRFLVFGRNQSDIRKVLGRTKIVDVLREESGMLIDGNDNQLIVCFQEKKIPSAKLPVAYARSRAVFRSLV